MHVYLVLFMLIQENAYTRSASMKDMVRDPIPEFEKEQQGKLFIPTCDLTKNMWLSIVVKGMLDWMNLGRIFF